MSATEIELRHQAIKRTLVQRGGNTPDAGVIADVTISTWNQVAARLAPVIGWTGVHILLARALQITRKDTPWLVLSGNPAPGAAQLDSLRACIAARDSDSAIEASYAVLANCTDLLASLIGNDLTDQLLDQQWASPPDALQKEIAP